MTQLMTELQAIHESLDTKTYGYYPDMCGTRNVWIEPDEETKDLLSRGAMLVEIMHLRVPLSYGSCTQIEFDLGTDWQMVMWNSQCPCPGVPEFMWNQDMVDDD